MRKKEEKERSIHGDDTNVLVKEFKPFAIKRFSSRMLNWILRDVDGTGIVTVDGKMLLKNTVIMEEFLHP